MSDKNINERKTIDYYFDNEIYKENVNNFEIFEHIFSRLEALESEKNKKT